VGGLGSHALLGRGMLWSPKHLFDTLRGNDTSEELTHHRASNASVYKKKIEILPRADQWLQT